jgi:alpha-glucuronidase
MNARTTKILFIIGCVFTLNSGLCDNGYELWLRYRPVANKALLTEYRASLNSWYVDLNSSTGNVIRKELQLALPTAIGNAKETSSEKAMVVFAIADSPIVKSLFGKSLNLTTKDGYVIKSVLRGKAPITVVAGSNEAGVLYGMFHLLRLVQTEQSLRNLNIEESPKTEIRILNHWDNLDRTVERGYAGFSIFDWHRLPDHIDQRYHDYARANASIGINAVVLTNVNANALVLTQQYLQKVKALADVFRPYGIRVFLTARFSSPAEIGSLKTSDPLNPEVIAWWNTKAEEIYTLIPDFGGFLVKANSEGQPGPQNFGRSHEDGANMLATALNKFGGIVMWRAFVYDNNDKTDRAKQAFDEFTSLDGKFAENVLVQVKNGPIDFQPREPFHPLFGAMPKTTVMPEFQITQEYLGFASHLVYLAPLFKETLYADTFRKGKGSFVARVIDVTLFNNKLTAMAGVSNVGNEINWCGHPFAQANWFSFGRLSWNHALTSEQIAREWIGMTFNNDPEVISNCVDIMMASREAAVNYMTPLGLHHIMGWDHHYGPAPWIANKQRADWTSVYYHRADSLGIGFDRSESGSNAIEQYAPELQKLFGSLTECPENLLLWFHHVKWDHKMKSGKTLWDELCYKYDGGVKSVDQFRKQWKTLQGKIDHERFDLVMSLLNVQYKEAIWWRNACVLYFQQFSRRPFPENFTAPDKDLKYYQSLEFPYAPGVKPKW